MRKRTSWLTSLDKSELAQQRIKLNKNIFMRFFIASIVRESCVVAMGEDNFSVLLSKCPCCGKKTSLNNIGDTDNSCFFEDVMEDGEAMEFIFCREHGPNDIISVFSKMTGHDQKDLINSLNMFIVDDYFSEIAFEKLN